MKNNLLHGKKTDPPVTTNESVQPLLTNVELWNVEHFSPF